MTLDVSASYLLGCTTPDSPTRFIVTPARSKITGCIGVNDFSNYGLSRASNGKRYMSYGTVDVVGISSGAMVLDNGIAGAYSRQNRTIEIVGRNPNLDGTNISCTLKLLVTRDGGAASILITGIDSYPTGRFGTDGTTPYTLSVSNVATDASTFTLNIAVSTGTATLRFEAFLIN